MATPVFRPSRITIIGPTPTIIPVIIQIALIWDGAVIKATNITVIINIGFIPDQALIIKAAIIIIGEAISVMTTVNAAGTLIGTADANGGVSSIVWTDGPMRQDKL
jgi:hypothetical protein